MTRFATLLALLLAAPAWAQNAATVFVGNQGQPASVTVIDPASGAVSQQFKGQLGGFIQGMRVIGDRLYVTGNGARIDVLDAVTGQRVAQVQDPAFTTARYIAPVGGGRAYVTTQTYDPSATSTDVVIIDTETNTVVGRIALPVTSQDGNVFGNPEGLAVVGTKAYVSQAAFGQGDEITVIDTATDTVLRSISTGCTARYPVADDDGDVVVPCTGGEEILVIDSDTDEITQRVAGPEGVSLGTGFAQDAVVATVDGQETVYIVASTGLVLFDPDTYRVTRTVAVADIEARGVTALGVDTGRQRLYLGRPAPGSGSTPFTADGTVTVHDLTGVLFETYAAGVFPTFVSVYARGGTASEPVASARPFSVSPPAPNPAVQGARVTVSLDAPAEVAVSVYDVLGRQVISGAPRALGAGETPVSFDVSALPAGLYVVRVVSAGGVASVPLTVAR